MSRGIFKRVKHWKLSEKTKKKLSESAETLLNKEKRK